MSDRLKSTNIASNVDIIEDLTKELKSSLSTEDKVDEFTINPKSSAGDLPTSSGDAPAAGSSSVFTDIPLNDSSDLDRDFKDPDEEEPRKNDDSDTDSIDEVSQKDAEMDLTDDQKAERQIIAEELKNQGNRAFTEGEYEQSIDKYTQGLRICPLQFTKQRAILYCNRSAAKMKELKYKQAIKDCTKAIELDNTYIKAYNRRAVAYEQTDKLDESLADYKKILELDPSHAEALKAVTRLPPLIEEKNEKLKTEMLGKLKDLGNMILKPFGLSTDNFQLEQDPDSKGYKINFKQ